MFPLCDGVSVVEFTCTIGPRVIRGVVRERQEAKRIFDRATTRGEAAGLLEQSLSASDVFIAKLGNVPAGEDVKVDVTYLGELEHDAEIDGLRFTIPTAIAPRYGYHAYSDLVSAPEVKVQGKIAVTVDIDLGPGCIVKSVQSPSHPISISIGIMSASASQDPSPQMASASLSLGSAELEKDFILQVVATGLGAPAALLEIHFCQSSPPMGGGKTMPNLKSALNIFLKSLPVRVRFNICSFGWEFRHVETFEADYGGTEMLAPVRQTFEKRIQESNLEVFLLTDGEIWNQDRLLGLIHHEVAASKGAARAGNGFSQVAEQDEKIDNKIVRMLKGALTPHVSDYTLEIKYDKSEQELEHGQGWLRHAKDAQGEPLREKWPGKFPQLVKREAVRLGVEHQIAGKWCSFVATPSDADKAQETGGDSPAALDEEDEVGDESCASLDDVDELSDDGGVSYKRPVGRGRPMATKACRRAASPVEYDDDDEEEEEEEEEKEEEEEDNVRVAKAELDALSILAALQTFVGSWAWSLQLEKVLGITKAEAASAIQFPIPGDVEDVLATLCAIAHLEKKMAADKDLWELMVDKAPSWLQDQVGRIEEELDPLGYNGPVAWGTTGNLAGFALDSQP
ncbi:von Willebrand domain containing protein, partial [Metarhizium majus ARSEF 297]